MPSEDQSGCLKLTSHQLAAALLKCPDVPVLVGDRQPDLSTDWVPATLMRPIGESGEWDDTTGIGYVHVAPAEMSKAWEGHWQITKLS